MTNPLLEPAALASSMEEHSIFDLRWRLGDPNYGRSTYFKGHIPGAIYVDLDQDLSSPPGPRGRHPLPSPRAFQATLGQLGITPDTSVVVYDDVGGMVAARLWWMLEAIGHRKTLVLDGGFEAWVATDLPVETGENLPTGTKYPGPIAFSGVVDISQLAERVVVDVRARERYEGSREPVDPRPGHIPGALNIPATQNLDGFRFEKPEMLNGLYASLHDPVFSCGSGVNACHSALAMVAAGLPRPDVFIGSYSEWSRSDRSVVTGSEPL